MVWEVVRREDSFEGSERPFISISSEHIAFNAMFTRIAEIDASYKVTVLADPENLRLGFEFHRDQISDCWALAQASSDQKSKKRKGLSFSSRMLIKKYKWVKGITKLPLKDRRFYNPRREGSFWVIDICPTFEERRARESAEIPSDARGIYRYLREDGEVVYIGRGEIKKRLMTPERKDWDFDIVEYSIINNPDQQINWE